jgi:hypothetical protein
MDGFFCKIVKSDAKRRKKRSLADSDFFWGQGKTIKIAFIEKDIDSELKQAIIDNIMEWQPYINLRLVFVEFAEDPGHVRISTEPGEKPTGWSAMGTDVLNFDLDKATLNIGVKQDHPAFRAAVKHEFGHVLGLDDEEIHPQANIPWDKQAVYDRYAKEKGMSPEEVDATVFYRIPWDSKSAVGLRYDKHSVMHGPIPNELTMGDWEVGDNSELSKGDKELISLIYPNTLPSPSRS